MSFFPCILSGHFPLESGDSHSSGELSLGVFVFTKFEDEVGFRPSSWFERKAFIERKVGEFPRFLHEKDGNFDPSLDCSVILRKFFVAFSFFSGAYSSVMANGKEKVSGVPSKIF
ncbi:hypothetical protein DLM75_19855 [Leptospira stimsonii]|uniref:Uncharacterized protein n=1 Tax=Leptospira stimsonii TaxID=2202203 RepID=A0A396YXY4_9LEPT|nr:hypothetical protein DLM75_19855 [Leptospira stimsonii]